VPRGRSQRSPIIGSVRHKGSSSSCPSLPFVTALWPPVEWGCPYGDFDAPSAGALTEHYQLKHRAVLQFACGFCRYTFGKPRVLGNHLWQVHQIGPSPIVVPPSDPSNEPAAPEQLLGAAHSPRSSALAEDPGITSDCNPVSGPCASVTPVAPSPCSVPLPPPQGRAPAHAYVRNSASASLPSPALHEASPTLQTGSTSPRRATPPPMAAERCSTSPDDSTDDLSADNASTFDDTAVDSADDSPNDDAAPSSVAPQTPITTRPSAEETSVAFIATWLEVIQSLLASNDQIGFLNAIGTISIAWLSTARNMVRNKYRGKRGLRRPPAQRLRNIFYDRKAQRRCTIAAELKGLYGVNRVRAIREALQPPSTAFTGDLDGCRAHWEEEGKARSVDSSNLDALLDCLPPMPDSQPNLTAPLTPEEVGRRLHRANNTAPGADRLEYRHLRALDPEAKLITVILNGCLRFQRVPDSWRTGTTILIYKKGDPKDPSNFRPITLLPTLYKLLAGCLAARLSKWAKESGVLSPQQKGFVPGVEGCLEQSFLVGSAFEESRDVGLHKDGLPIFSAFLDLQNAFGSVPHASLLRVLRRVGVNEDFCEFVNHLYADSSVALRVNNTNLTPFLTTAGVRQGDPLSPILFDLAMEPVVRRAACFPEHGFPIGVTRLTVCALADDLALFADTEAHLQQRVSSTDEAATTIGLRFRPSKCAVIARRSKNDITAQITLQGAVIPWVDKDHAVTYLGAPQGLSRPRAEYEQATLSLTRDINLLKACSLAPWQKLDALRTFLLPRLDYLCRAKYSPNKSLLQEVDDALVAFCRDVCGLSCIATQHIFFGHRANGGLGFVRLSRNAQILHVTQACRMLCSDDPVIVGVARHRLSSAIDRAKGDSSSDAGLIRFLGGDGLTCGEKLHTYTQSSKHSSFWTDVRRCLLDLGVRLNMVDGRVQSLTHSTKAEKHIRRRRQGEVPVARPDVESDFLPRLSTQKLRQFARDAETAAWKARKVQGVVARCLEYDPYATHSRFYWTGTGLSFRQFRFAFRARLQVLQSRVRLASFTRSTKNPTTGAHLCRCCGKHPETIVHVLDHCKKLMKMITERHNSIVRRLAEALPRSTSKFIVDKRPVRRINQRPDLSVWTDKGDVVLVDVTCPFESGENALDNAFQIKVDRYSALAHEMLTGDVRSAVVRPFVVGALGGWHPGNEQCLQDLGIPRYRRKMLRELCVADAIVGSEAIWSRLESGLLDRREADPSVSVQPLPGAGSQPDPSDGAAQQVPSAC